MEEKLISPINQKSWIGISIGLYVFFLLIGSTISENVESIITNIISPIFIAVSILTCYKNTLLKSELKYYLLFLIWGLWGFTVAIDMPLLYRGLKTTLGAGLIVLAFYLILNRYDVRKHIFFAIILGGLFACFYSSQNEIVEDLSFSQEERLSSFYGNSNVFGFLILNAIISSFFLIEIYKTSLLIRSSLISLIGVFLFFIVIAASRKTFLGVILFFGLYYYYSRIKYSRQKFIYILITIPLYFIISYGFEFVMDNTLLGSRLTKAVEEGDESREILLLEGLQTFYNHLMVGVGLGNARLYSTVDGVTHIDLLEIGVCTGALGVLFYILFFIVSWLNNNISIKFYKDPLIVKHLIFTKCVIILFLVLGLSRVSFQDIPNMMFLSFFLAYSNKIYNQIKISEPSKL